MQEYLAEFNPFLTKPEKPYLSLSFYKAFSCRAVKSKGVLSQIQNMDPFTEVLYGKTLRKTFRKKSI